MSVQSTLDQTMSVKKCPECGGHRFMQSYEDNQMFCENCGFAMPREHPSQKLHRYEKLLQLIESGSIVTVEICQKKYPEISSATFNSTMKTLHSRNLVHRILMGKRKVAYKKTREFNIYRGREAIKNHHEEITRKYRTKKMKTKISTESDGDTKALDNLLDAFLNTIELFKEIESKCHQATVILTDVSKQLPKLLNSRRGSGLNT